ncbi:hypothetical protein DWQ67_10170 [Galactobacter caseinivorans]|uniref:Uncharacterized protein n=1 Tax=Galactobacter caseinivorans TaxID=2676123 RepID=A0A496PHA0_9MICC|nr:hypothetical protein DWQ67_10170 [Galactobacter caseinivorans]
MASLDSQIERIRNDVKIVLESESMRLARDERQDMVRMLADEGVSTRAIAPIVGVLGSGEARHSRLLNWLI